MSEPTVQQRAASIIGAQMILRTSTQEIAAALAAAGLLAGPTTSPDDEPMVERIARIIATHVMNAEYVKTHGISYYLPVAEALYARGFRLVEG